MIGITKIPSLQYKYSAALGGRLEVTMTYVMSCLNGAYSDLLRMLEHISFGSRDVLFLLGDISDSGDEPMELIDDLSCRENIWPIKGDRDAATYKMLGGFARMLESGESPSQDFIIEMNRWASDGGRVALDGFRALDADMREGALDYLADMAEYDTVHVGDVDYLLVHTGISGYSEGRDLDSYPEGAFYADGDVVRSYPGMVTVVGSGDVTEFSKATHIRRGDGYIGIDCGVGRGGRLACLCLDNGEEYYI